jgi:hypothetical protein
VSTSLLDHSGGRADAGAFNAAAVARAVGALGRNPIRHPGQGDHDESNDPGDPKKSPANFSGAVNAGSHVISPCCCFLHQNACRITGRITRFEIVGNAANSAFLNYENAQNKSFIFNNLFMGANPLGACAHFFRIILS